MEKEVKYVECEVLNCQLDVSGDNKVYIVSVVMPSMPRNKVKIVLE